MIEVYSEKLDATITVPDESNDMEHFAELDSTSLVGWVHGGWSNSGGGGNW